MQFIDLKAQYNTMKDQINSEIQKVLESCSFIMGPQVEECEKNLLNYVGAKKALTCASGTDAIVMALMALDIKHGDEVIVPAFSFFATAECVSLVGATPVFVDIEDVTYNIDVKQIEKAITKNTKAIIFVSLYGQTPDVDAILAIGKKYNLPVIEDAAQSFGATYKGKKSCNIAPISCTSFFPAKPLGCYGDGGAIFINDESLFQPLKEIRSHGQSERYVHSRVGINGRMDTIQCAILNVKLSKFEWEVERRLEIGNTYTQAFTELGDKIRTPVTMPDRTHVFGQYTLYVENREKFIKILNGRGVPTSIHYPSPMHKQKPYLKYNANMPVSDRCAAHVVSLPLYPYISEQDMGIVIDAVKAASKEI